MRRHGGIGGHEQDNSTRACCHAWALRCSGNPREGVKIRLGSACSWRSGLTPGSQMAFSGPTARLLCVDGAVLRDLASGACRARFALVGIAEGLPPPRRTEGRGRSLHGPTPAWAAQRRGAARRPEGGCRVWEADCNHQTPVGEERRSVAADTTCPPRHEVHGGAPAGEGECGTGPRVGTARCRAHRVGGACASPEAASLVVPTVEVRRPPVAGSHHTRRPIPRGHRERERAAPAGATPAPTAQAAQ